MKNQKKGLGVLCCVGLILGQAPIGIASIIVHDAFLSGTGDQAGKYNAGEAVGSDHNKSVTATEGSWGVYNWGGSGVLGATSTNLSFGGMSTSGGGLLKTGLGATSRLFGNTAANQKVYYSFLVNFSDFGSTGYAVLGLATAGTGTDQWTTGIRVNTNGTMNAMVYGGFASSSVSLSLNTTYLIVGELEFNQGTTSSEFTSIWVNPVPGETQAETGTRDLARSGTRSVGDYTSVDRVLINGAGSFNGNFIMDELRVGTTWEDVVAIPEPSTLTLFMISSVSLLLRKAAAR